jgi:hypothetical protein
MGTIIKVLEKRVSHANLSKIWQSETKYVTDARQATMTNHIL